MVRNSPPFGGDPAEQDATAEPPVTPDIDEGTGGDASTSQIRNAPMNMMTKIQAQASGATVAEALPIGDYAAELVANEPLPLHAATDDEPIPPLGERPWDGPDMRAVAPIEQMLDWLRECDPVDDVAYLMLWQALVRSIGMSVLICYERDGEEGLMVGGPCDAQARHRNRWMHFLLADLELVETRRELLMKQLRRSGPSCDRRLRDPGATTQAVRTFLAAGGRLLIDPEGHLEEAGDFPMRGEVGRQSQSALTNYFAVRRRFRSDPQIKRAVRMLGTRTDNGWIVLERKER